MKPGQYLLATTPIVCNEGREAITLAAIAQFKLDHISISQKPIPRWTLTGMPLWASVLIFPQAQPFGSSPAMLPRYSSSTLGAPGRFMASEAKSTALSTDK